MPSSLSNIFRAGRELTQSSCEGDWKLLLPPEASHQNSPKEETSKLTNENLESKADARSFLNHPQLSSGPNGAKPSLVLLIFNDDLRFS